MAPGREVFALGRTGFDALFQSRLRRAVGKRLRFPPSLLEGALADLMADGEFSAHIRRMRGRYGMARDAVADTLAAHAGGALQVAIPDQGLHLVARLQPDPPPGAAARIRDAARVQAWLLSETRLEPDPSDGFVLGFSGHGIAELRDGAKRLARAAMELKAVDSGRSGHQAL